MKINWSAVLLTGLCFILLLPVHLALSRTVDLSGQDSGGRQPRRSAAATPTPRPTTRNRSAPAARNQEPARSGATATGSRPPAPAGSPKTENANPPDPNTGGENTDDKLKELTTLKAELNNRVDTALKTAQEAVAKAEDPSFKDRLKEQTSIAQTLHAAINGARAKEDLIGVDNRVEQFEATTAELVNDATPGWLSNVTLTGVIAFLAFFLLLGMLAGVLYLWSKLRARLDHLAIQQDALWTAERETRQLANENKTHAERVEAELLRIAGDLGVKIESAKRTSEEAKKLARTREAAPNNSDAARMETLPEIPPEPSFPSLVADYLSRLRTNQPTTVEADFRTNRLVAAEPENAPFFFIEDNDGSGAGIVLPKPRLARSQEFSSYYQEYYHCSDPSAGEVYIIEPAIVCPDGKGWRLRHMGRMEIR